MALLFNGTSSKGVFSGNLATGGEPYAIFAWVKFTSTSVDGMVAGFADAGGPTYDECAIYAHGGTGKIRGYYKLAGANPYAVSTNSLSTSWQPVLCVFDKNTRVVYYGSGGAGTPDTTATSGINAANVDNFSVGVWPETGNSLFFGGELAEVWIWRGTGTVPDATDWTSLQAGALPETIKASGIVEGWSLLNQAATQTGYNGRTLAMTSTTQGGAHPITRTAGPSLTSPTVASVTATTATSGITTDTANGTLYTVLSLTNSAPSASQVKAGQNSAGAAAAKSSNQAVSSTGAKTVAWTALSASTTYYPFWVHTNASSVDSSVVAGTSFTTSAAAATAVTLTDPGSMTSNVGVASGNFTVGANGSITGTVVVTPSDGGGGGTFTPTTISISSGSPTGTFTYTPGSAGAKTISVTNNGGLTDPGSTTYTAVALPSISVTFRNNTNALQTSTTIPKVGIYKLADMTAALILASQVTNSSGVLTVASSSLTSAVDYLVVASDATGAKVGVQKVTST